MRGCGVAVWVVLGSVGAFLGSFFISDSARAAMRDIVDGDGPVLGTRLRASLMMAWVGSAVARWMRSFVERVLRSRSGVLVGEEGRGGSAIVGCDLLVGMVVGFDGGVWCEEVEGWLVWLEIVGLVGERLRKEKLFEKRIVIYILSYCK